jgi:hypothetical protein
MAGKEQQRLTTGLVGYGATLKTFRSKLSGLSGEFTFSVAINHGGYRVLSGLATDDVENLIRAQDNHPITVLYIWAVFR